MAGQRQSSMVKLASQKMVEIVFAPEQLKAMRIAPVQLKSKAIGNLIRIVQTDFLEKNGVVAGQNQ
jgi:hypothetical protein